MASKLVNYAIHEYDVLNESGEYVDCVEAQHELVTISTDWYDIVEVEDEKIDDGFTEQIVEAHARRTIQVKDASHVSQVKAVHA